VDLRDNPESLQSAFNYLALRKTVRIASIGVMLFGLLAMIVGTNDRADDSFELIWLVVGGIFVLQSIWGLILPSRAALLLNVILLIAGGWLYLAAFVMLITHSTENMLGYIFLGIWQIKVGFRRLSSYQRFADTKFQKVDKDTIEWLKNAALKISQTGLAYARDVIAFSMVRNGKDVNWSGLIFGDTGIFIEEKSNYVVVAKKEDVSFEPECMTDALTTGCAFHFGKAAGRGTILKESFERYDAWKKGLDVQIDMAIPSLLDSIKPIATEAQSVDWEALSQPLAIEDSVLQTEAGPVNYAGFWRRFVAHTLDVIFGLVLAAAIYFIIWILFLAWYDKIHRGKEDFDISEKAVGYTILAAFLLGTWLHHALLESSYKKATVGKMVVGIFVTDVQGKRISFWRASGRFWSKAISWLILGIGFIMAAFTGKKQALHDLNAGSVVVRKASAPKPVQELGGIYK
jgi:uncharacterized RDD family membrane protein YckC